MIVPPAGTRIWIAAGITDMRRGFDGLAALVQTQLQADPFSGQLFVFGAGVETGSRCCGGTATGCACSPSGSSTVNSSGRR